MDKPNLIRDKSFNFALKIIALHKTLIRKNEFVIGRQVLCSGTSIGANVEESSQTQSRKDFVSKLSIALKEVYETRYWLRLLHGSEYISEAVFREYFADIEELKRILTSIIKTTKNS